MSLNKFKMGTLLEKQEIKPEGTITKIIKKIKK